MRNFRSILDAVSCSVALAACDSATVPLVMPPTIDQLACISRACGEGCTRCDDPEAACAKTAVAAFCGADGACSNEAPRECPDPHFLTRDRPGSGEVFVMNTLAIAGEHDGFDLDGRCFPDGTCGENSGWILGLQANDILRLSLLGGEPITVIELVREGASGTIQFYAAADADDPFFPANNFHPPVTGGPCCEFLIRPSSVRGSPPRAIARMPVRIEGERFHSDVPVRLPNQLLDLSYFLGVVALEHAVIDGIVRDSGLSETRVGGGAVIFELARYSTEDFCRAAWPFCGTTALETFLGAGLEPDLDLDGDGLETLADTDGDGIFDLCFDGCAEPCAEPDVVAPLDASNPRSCAESPRMADGFTITYALTAVPATVVGIGD